MKTQNRYAIVLTSLVILIWIFFDFIVKKETPFNKDSEFFFQGKTLQQIKNFAEKSFNDYLASEENNTQVHLLVNAIECNYFLLYANKLSVPRFYDFINIILLPSQRNELKEKRKYVYEIKRYLRRKRNLEIQYLKYEISKPEQAKNKKNSVLKIRVIRKNADNDENLTYYFKKFKQRYYLYLKKWNGIEQPPISIQEQNIHETSNE